MDDLFLTAVSCDFTAYPCISSALETAIFYLLPIQTLEPSIQKIVHKVQTQDHELHACNVFHSKTGHMYIIKSKI